MSETYFYRLDMPGNWYKQRIVALAPFIADVQSAAISTKTDHSYHTLDNRIIVYRYTFELPREELTYLKLKWAEFKTHLSEVTRAPAPTYQTQSRKRSETL